jgi:hypothetical protein
MLEQDAAVAVDDRLRQAGRAGREEHVERVVERDRVEIERPRFGQELLPWNGVGKRVASVRDVDDGVHGREPGADLGHLVAPVDPGLAPAVAVDCEEDARLELAEAVEHASGAELRRAGRPDRAEAGGGQERDQRLGDVRQVGDDPVAGADAEPPEPGARPCHLVAQVAEGQVERVTRLRAGEHRDRVELVVTAEHVRREVQPGAREPLGAGHRPRAEHALVRGIRPNLEEVPDRRPEAVEVGHRPSPEVDEVLAAATDRRRVASEERVLARVLGRRPNHLSDREGPLRRDAHPAAGG